MSHYYESHVTIEPVFDERRDLAEEVAAKFGFKLAKLLLRKRLIDTPERSADDTFMTGHSQDFTDIYERTRAVVQTAQKSGFTVWRYKIESAIVDSRSGDVWELLNA